MFDYPYLIELLSPKKGNKEKVEPVLDRFAERFRQVMASGCGISVPDNPMGQERMSLLTCLVERGLDVEPKKLAMTVNTFHSKGELDDLLNTAARLQVRYLLVVRGDGGPGLEKLDPRAIGGKYNVATTQDLLRYIHRTYPGVFTTGVAFNPYKGRSFEVQHLEGKLAAGAQFIVTQPILANEGEIDFLKDYGVPLIVEAWMSNNINLFYRSIGRKQEVVTAEEYDPIQNLKELHKLFPGECFYLAMVNLVEGWQRGLPRLRDRLDE